MKVQKNDKLRLIKPMGLFRNIGEICIVDTVDDCTVSFYSEKSHIWGCMSEDEVEKYFELVNKRNTVTSSQIDAIIASAKIDVFTVYDKCTVVTAQLPNGFVMVESSACVDPRNYDSELGYNACIKRIKDRLWELEGYKLQCKVAGEV